MPVLHDSALSIELVAEGLKFPTSLRFIDGPDNNNNNNNSSNILLLVLQKNDGQVRLVSGDGWRLADRPVLQAHVESRQEQGLLGIAAKGTDVYLYMTQNTTAGVTKNRIYKYSYDAAQQALVNETLVLELPGMPGPFHNGGKIAIGPRDDRLYAVIGDTAAGGGYSTTRPMRLSPGLRTTSPWCCASTATRVLLSATTRSMAMTRGWPGTTPTASATALAWTLTP